MSVHQQKVEEARHFNKVWREKQTNDIEDIPIWKSGKKEGDSKVINIMNDTKKLRTVQIIEVVAKELGICHRVDKEVYFIEQKLYKLQLDLAVNGKRFFLLLMPLIKNLDKDWDLGTDQQEPLDVDRQKDEEQNTLEFYEKRKKNSRIPDTHKIRLVLDAKKNLLSINQICAKYFIGYSTARSILKEITDYRHFLIYQEARLKDRKLEQLHVKKIIDEFLWSSRDALTIKKIRSHVMERWGANLPWHQVRNYLRRDKSLSFKKGSKRTINIDSNRLSYLRILYSIRLSKQIDENVLLINIDGVNFSPNVLNCRSWLKRGTSWEIFNKKFSGAVSLIWAISSERDYLAASLNKTLDSNIFIEFLKMIEHWILSNNQTEESKVIILLDNWSIHKSEKSVQYMRQTPFRYMFLPHYSPTLAPIELVFAKLKKTASDFYTNEVTDWKSKKGTHILNECFRRIDPSEIIRCFNHSLNVWGKYIDNFKYHLSKLNQAR